MQPYVEHRIDVMDVKVSHDYYGLVENKQDLDVGIYLIEATGSHFGEVRADNPRVMWHLDTVKFLMNKQAQENDR
jgi:hypothetical protein